METALLLVVVAAVVGGVELLVRRTGGSAPLVLVLVGVVASYLPFVPPVVLDPELVLVGLLPPLLYASALRTSLVDVRSDLRPIALLSVGLVAVTALVVGLVIAALLPVPLAVGIALGAVVAPPDAVAATAVARRVGLPRRVVTVLEGESLLNDATALVLLRTALVAVAGAVSAAEVGARFLLAAGGGVLVGVVVAALAGRLRRRLDDEVLDTTLSFAAPFVAYLPAEEVGASGVLAVVVTGLLLGHRSPVQQTARSRIAERLNWRTVQFLLEGGVFLLIGLQASDVVGGALAGDLGLGRTLLVCGAVLAVVVLVRLVYVAVALPLAGLVGRRAARGAAGDGGSAPEMDRDVGSDGRADGPSWRVVAVIGWAGMRGVVTLAAAASLPASTPQREVLVLAALVVVGGTLLLQGTTLPQLVRALALPPPDPGEDALVHAAVLDRTRRAAERRLEQVRREEDSDDVVDGLRERLRRRGDVAWERLGRGGDHRSPGRAWARLRLEMLDAERAELLAVRDEGRAPDEVLRQVLAELDVEESLLDAAVARDDRTGALRAPVAGSCRHLRDAPAPAEDVVPAGGEGGELGCQGCLALGERRWEHLRQCLACGYVGCCDSSPHQHAQAHARTERHPVIRSAEPGEAWRWCYVDRELG
ncbi:cation:proton antiporter [Pseudokineococcus sp. 5B2Z-1]|uniref:cation:proton antiporter domain-containing protein n=1 Tax=Pseudokineococcus sp. 5B2Z-1 TaxID=3132744 RepID=UPI0030AF835C